MALEDIEIDIGGGNKVKGVWIAILFTFASTIGGGIYASAEFFGRLDALENTVNEAVSRTAVVEGRFDDLRDTQNQRLQDYQVTISNMEQQLADNEVGSLQSRLAELGTNLEAIMAAQAELLTIRDRIATVEKTNSETILKVDAKIQALDGIDKRISRLQKDIDDAWTAMDELANPLGR